MALIGDLVIYTTVDTGATEMINIEYPLDYPDALKAGTTEQKEAPIMETTATPQKNAYVTVHSVNSWKFQTPQEDKTLFNITYRVYKSKTDRLEYIDSHILQDFIVSQTVDFSSNADIIEQAYEIIKSRTGFENLIND
jgi:hypothetical protein